MSEIEARCKREAKEKMSALARAVELESKHVDSAKLEAAVDELCEKMEAINMSRHTQKEEAQYSIGERSRKWRELVRAGKHSCRPST